MIECYFNKIKYYATEREFLMKKFSFYESPKYADVRDLVYKGAEKYGQSTVYRELDKDKQFIDHSFIETKAEMNALGTALMNMGLKGSHIAVIGENRYDWVLSYLAIINGVGVVVPIDKEMTPNEITMQIEKADCEAVIVSASYLPSLKSGLSEISGLKYIISMDLSEHSDDVMSLHKLIEDGADAVARGDRAYIDMPIDKDAVAEIIFTSGTTGSNKGVMLSHGNLVHVLYGSFALIDSYEKIHISVLPVSHSFECTEHVLAVWHCGSTLCFCKSLRYISDSLKQYKPHFALMVPLMLESMQKSIMLEVKRSKLESYFKWGLHCSKILRKVGIDKRRQFFNSVLSKLGGNIEQVVCGGAPLKEETRKFFDSIGINIVNGYGISECAPLLSANCTGWNVPGSVGKVIPGVEIEIRNKDDNGIGEIHAKGPNVFLGYYKDEESTRATMNNGWFDTGDLGKLDKKGMLYITGRKKNLIILSNGKNVSAEELEDAVQKYMPYVKEIVVTSSDHLYVDGKSKNGEIQICALMYIDPEYIEEKGLNDPVALHDHVYNELNNKVNPKLSHYKRITSVSIRDTEFIKTSSKKIKRHMAISQ